MEVFNNLDDIDNYIREKVYSHPYCNYKGLLPPIKNAPKFCDKYGVEIRATLYKTNPDYSKYIFDERLQVCTITNVRLETSDVKNATNIYVRKEGNKEYQYGDVQINKLYGKIVYKYWKHLIDNNFCYAIESQKYKNELEEKMNRKYYAELLIKQMLNS